MKRRALVVLAGIGTVAYGIVGLFGSAHRIALTSAGEWFIGSALVHDAVIAPVVIVTGVILARLLPGGMRPYVQSGLVISGGLLLVATPFLTGRGYQPGNPSALALDYGRGTAIAIGCVWAGVIVVAAARTAAGRRRVHSREEAAGLDSSPG